MLRPALRDLLTRGLNLSVALPAVALGFLILRYGVDVPYWDQWGTIALSVKLHNHTLTFTDLFEQLNENRILFTRLLLLGIDFLSQGNVKYEMLASLLLATIILWNIWYLGTRTVPTRNGARVVASILVSFLIFGPIQYQNWLMGIQVEMFLPVACLTTSISVFSNPQLGKWFKLFVVVALSTVATFNYSNGMICWVLLFPLLWMAFQKNNGRPTAVILWVVSAVANLSAYFYHYYRPANHPKISEAFLHPALTIRCFLGFLGAPLGFGTGYDDLTVSGLVGVTALLFVGVISIKVWQLRNRSGILERTVPWLAIAGYSLGSAVAVTLGRMGIASYHLLDSRYTSVSLYLYVALIFLLTILSGGDGARRQEGSFGLLFLAVLLLTLYTFTSTYAVLRMQGWRTDLLAAKSCLAFIDVIDDPCQPQRLDWNPLLKTRADALDAMHFFHPALVTSRDLRSIAAPLDSAPNEHGVFESLRKGTNGFYRATGWAALPEGNRAADVVLLSYAAPDGALSILAIVDQMSQRTNASSQFRWEKWMRLPTGADRIQAWAYDALSGRAFRLSQEHLASSAPLQNIRFVPDRTGGSFDGIVNDKSGPGSRLTFKAWGWAVLRNSFTAPETVLITCGDENKIVAAGPPRLERPDVPDLLHDSRFLKSGWSIPVHPDEFPTRTCELQAWAFDGITGDAFLLSGSQRAE